MGDESGTGCGSITEGPSSAGGRGDGRCYLGRHRRGRGKVGSHDLGLVEERGCVGVTGGDEGEGRVFERTTGTEGLGTVTFGPGHALLVVSN